MEEFNDIIVQTYHMLIGSFYKRGISKTINDELCKGILEYQDIFNTPQEIAVIDDLVSQISIRLLDSKDRFYDFMQFYFTQIELNLTCKTTKTISLIAFIKALKILDGVEHEKSMG